MNNKTLYIFDSPILFNILEELKNNLSFKIVYLNKKDYQRINFEELTNYLIIAINFREENKNVLIVDNLPIRITNLVEKINIFFLKNQFIQKSRLKVGKYLLDLNARKIIFDKLDLNITEKECELIMILNSKKKVSLKTLQEEVWRYSSELDTHTVETHIYRLRKKMSDTFKDENFISFNDKHYYLT
tara:strand:- start:3288 stop:3848 length:561 start_codon:yes stop_codon:yes gene_type:complete